MTDEEILALWAITADEVAHANSKDGADLSYREDCRISFARAVAARERERCAEACEGERIEGDNLVSDDVAYNLAIEHATSAIRALGDGAKTER